MKKNKHIDLATILAYLKGKLSNQERHELESATQKDPFLEDALEGMSQLKAEDLEHDLHKLQEQLLQKSSKKSQSIKLWLRYAATIALLIGAATIIKLLVLDPDLPPVHQELSYEAEEISEEEISIIEEKTHPKPHEKKELQKDELRSREDVSYKTKDRIIEPKLVPIVDELAIDDSEMEVDQFSDESIQEVESEESQKEYFAEEELDIELELASTSEAQPSSVAASEEPKREARQKRSYTADKALTAFQDSLSISDHIVEQDPAVLKPPKGSYQALGKWLGKKLPNSNLNELQLTVTVDAKGKLLSVGLLQPKNNELEAEVEELLRKAGEWKFNEGARRKTKTSFTLQLN